MYTAYPEIWDEKKFRTPKYRYKVAHCFLVAQTKKMRVKTPAKRAAPAAKKRPSEEGSDFSEEPPAKVQKVFPDLEFPEFICVLRFSDIRKSINYQEVRDFEDLVAWIRLETELTRDMVVWIDIVIRDSEYAELMGAVAGDLVTERNYVRDQGTWNTAILNSQLNRDISWPAFRFMSVQVAVPGGKEPIRNIISAKPIDDNVAKAAAAAEERKMAILAEEAKKKAEEDKKAEEEAKKKAVEEARKKAEVEVRERAEAEAREKAEVEAREKAEVEAEEKRRVEKRAADLKTIEELKVITVDPTTTKPAALKATLQIRKLQGQIDIEDAEREMEDAERETEAVGDTGEASTEAVG